MDLPRSSNYTTTEILQNPWILDKKAWRSKNRRYTVGNRSSYAFHRMIIKIEIRPKTIIFTEWYTAQINRGGTYMWVISPRWIKISRTKWVPEGGPPLVYRCSLDQASSELTAPILKSLGILEREPFIFLCGIFFSGSDHVPLRYSSHPEEESIFI